jgi:plastocyanin
MLRKTAGAAFIALAMIFAARCHNDNNNALTNPPLATSTPVPGGPTATPVPGAPTPTPAPSGQTVTVEVGAGGGNVFSDDQTGTSESHIHVGDTIQWVWDSGFHSTTSGTCAGGCTPDGRWNSGTGSGMTFSHQFTQAGTFPYFCLVHGSMMQGQVVVQ